MQLIGRFSVTKYYYKRAIEELRTVYFNLVCECVPRELCYITLQVKYMQAYFTNMDSELDDVKQQSDEFKNSFKLNMHLLSSVSLLIPAMSYLRSIGFLKMAN